MKKVKWYKGYCESCGADNVLVTEFTGGRKMSDGTYKQHTHCEICYTTVIGNSCEYPEQYETSTLRALAEIANYVIKKFGNS